MLDSRIDLDRDLLPALRAGDAHAFAALVDEMHGPLIALARTFTSSRVIAEDAVQETWLAVIRGLDRFEGRSTLKTWLYGILVRRARTLAAREARQREARAAAAAAAGTATAPVARNGHLAEVEWSPGLGRLGLWDERPSPWRIEDPSLLYQRSEALEVVQAALEKLPSTQRQVVLLRDVEAFSATEVCNILTVSETNQRVLLHRGRAAIRKALDRYLKDGVMPRGGRMRGEGVGT